MESLKASGSGREPGKEAREKKANTVPDRVGPLNGDWKIDSLRKRYSFKLGANLTGLPISLVAQSLIARGLGPVSYGDFNFLTNFFNQAVGLFDSGTSLGFYTKLSQRQREETLVKFYWSFTFIVAVLLAVVLALIYLFKQGDIVFPNQQLRYVELAFVWGLLTWSSQIVSKMVDAYGLTTGGEIIRAVQKFFSLILVLGLFYTKLLNLTNFFYYNYIIIIALCLGWYFVLKKNGIPLFPRVKLHRAQVKEYVREFYEYSGPLVTYSLVGMVVGILDLWLLQRFAGSVQQGFYALSFKVSAICLLFTSAMTPLLTREFSVAFGSKNLGEMRKLFGRYIPLLYTVAAVLSVFLAVHANEVTLLFGGSAFQKASLPMTLMVLYPIHQTYGQLSGSVFYASGQTRLYRNIGITTMLGGLFFSFVLLAPNSMYGLDMGALGLAIKMLLIQFIGVNIQLFFNARFLSLSFKRYFLHQVATVALLGAIAFASRAVFDFIPLQLVFSFLLSGILYVILTAVMLFIFPQTIAISREEQKKYVRLALTRLFRTV